RNLEAILDLSEKLEGAEVSALRGDPPLPLGAERLRDLVHVRPLLHRLLLREVADRKVLIPDHQADFPLLRLAAHEAAEYAERREVLRVLDVLGTHVAVNEPGLVMNEGAALVVAPNALGLGIRGRSAERPTEQLERSRDPLVLVDRGHSVALDARHEQDDQRALPAAQAGGLAFPIASFPGHVDQYRSAQPPESRST